VVVLRTMESSSRRRCFELGCVRPGFKSWHAQSAHDYPPIIV